MGSHSSSAVDSNTTSVVGTNTTTAASSGYRYRPLQARNTIRLVNLLPCDASAPDQSLKCNITEVSLSNNPEYVALSYTWGDNVFPMKLFCDGSAFEITTNLHSALLQFRLPDRNLKIWIDAVSINQKDDDEKSHQLPLMGSIYRQATEVLIWLGEASENSDDVMKYLKRIGQQFFDRGGPVKEPRDERSPENDLIWADVTGDPSLERTSIIWQRPWFTRRWVIQELALAQKATVQCGSVTVDWNVLTYANLAFMRLGGDGSQLRDRETGRYRRFRAGTAMNMWRLNEIRKRIQASSVPLSKRRIYEIFDNARAFDCRDAKDRVFALLAIFNHQRQNPLELDYVKSPAEVYIEFTKYCLQNDITTDVLSLAGTANHSLLPETFHLPSWAVDWRLSGRSPFDTLTGFDAGCRLASMMTFSGPPSSQELVARGLIVDKIIGFVPPISLFREAEVGPPFSSLQLKALLQPSFVATWYEQIEILIYRLFRTTYPTPRPYLRGGDLWEALAKTLIIDRTDVVFDYRRDSERPGSSDAETWPHWEGWMGFRNVMLRSAQEAREERTEIEPGGGEAPLIFVSYEQIEYALRPPGICEDRCFFITQHGYIGLGPSKIQLMDVVVVLAGSSVPHVVRPESGADFRMIGEPALPLVELRRPGLAQMPDGTRRPYIMREKEERFTLIGEAYVHGIMNDEVWDVNGIFFEDVKIV